MNQFDHLIPQHIIQKMILNSVELELVLKASPAGGIWPRVKVSVNSQVLFDGTVIEKQTITHSNKHDPGTEVRLSIEYLDKTDQHTLVDDQGQLIENQSVLIESIKLNDVDLVQTNLIYNFGKYFYNLSETKKQYFKTQRHETEFSHSLHMCENGSWILDLKVPILPELIKHKALHEKHEIWPDDKFMNDMYNTIKRVEDYLTKTGKHHATRTT